MPVSDTAGSNATQRESDLAELPPGEDARVSDGNQRVTARQCLWLGVCPWCRRLRGAGDWSGACGRYCAEKATAFHTRTIVSRQHGLLVCTPEYR